MAEDKFEAREINYRQYLPWTQLFRAFWVALDLKKLLLAAAGIVVMFIGWWMLAYFFGLFRTPPDWGAGNKNWSAFKEDNRAWNLFYEAAGSKPVLPDANDLAESEKEFDQFKTIENELRQKTEEQVGEELFKRVRRGNAAKERSKDPKDPSPQKTKEEIEDGELATAGLKWFDRREKPYGKLRTPPWFEGRGPNPFLMVIGRAGHREADGAGHALPWEPGKFFDWLFRDQLPVLLEPLVKFLRPVFYLLSPTASFWDRIYFLLVTAWTVVTWAIFGGAITRMAAVEVARNEKMSMLDALRFVRARWQSYVFASFAPLLGLALFIVLIFLFGIINWIPVLAELWVGLLFPLVIGGGLAMAVILVGLVGWPMIHATLGAEGSDSFDALSRCYSYVIQRPWSYLGYAIVALTYGAAVVFFVGFMGSLMIYLGKWSLSQTPLNTTFNRDPSYMFVYAPSSFGWKEMLLQGSPVVAQSGGVVTDKAVQDYVDSEIFRGWNSIGAVLVAFWLYLVFLLIVGFGYSYFWSASTITYLLMRRKVDDTDLDEVYLEEEESEESYTPPVSSTPAASPPATSGGPVQMVESPALRQTTSPSPPGSSGNTPSPGDGNVPAGGEASS